MNPSRISLIVGSAALCAAVLIGQGAGAAVLPPVVSLSVSPESPAPGQTITAEARLFGQDPGGAVFTWFANGRAVPAASGIGRASAEFRAPASGAALVIGLEVLGEGGAANAEATVRSNRLGAYWWAETETPYWYRAKALAAPNSVVHVLALVTGRPATALSYTWTLDDNIQPDASGLGRSGFVFRTSFVPEQDHFITVRAEDAGALIGEAALRVATRTPIARIYRLRPLSGVAFEQALRSFAGAGGQRYEFVAEPFSFTAPRSKLSYQWNFNGSPLTGIFAAPWRFTLESKPGEVSQSRISVAVSNPRELTEQSNAGLSVTLR